MPNRIVEVGKEIALGGMRFAFIDLGPMEAANNSVIMNLDRDFIFTGDATAAHAVFLGGKGNSCGALNGLTLLTAITSRRGSDTLAYPGHYSPMRLTTMITDNMAQLRYLRGLVRTALSDSGMRNKDGNLTDPAVMSLSADAGRRMERYAAYGLSPEDFLGSVIPAIAREIRQELETGSICREDPSPAQADAK